MVSVLERMKIRSRTKAALAVKKARGERVGTVAFGYRVAADGVHLEPNPTEQETIGAIRRRANAGMSLRGIAADLALAGFVGRTGRPLTHIQVRRVLQGAAA